MGNCFGRPNPGNDENAAPFLGWESLENDASSTSTYWSATEGDLEERDLIDSIYHRDTDPKNAIDQGDAAHRSVPVFGMEQAVEIAQEHASKARVLKARDALLAVVDAPTWRQHGNETACRILDEADIVERAMNDLDMEGGYAVSRERPIRILYKPGEGTSHSIKIKANIGHHPARVVSIPYEWDLLTTWNRFCVESVKFWSENPHHALVYGASWMFPPFRDFQALMLAAGFDLSDEYGALLITVRDAGAPGGVPDNVSLPKATKKRRWVQFLDNSYVLLKPVFVSDGVTHTSATISVHLDPRIAGIPASIVNWVLHVFAPYLFHAIERTLEDLFHEGSVYRLRMATSSAVYGIIEDVVDTLRARSAHGTTEPNQAH